MSADVESRRTSRWRYVRAMAPAIFFGSLMIGLFAYSVVARGYWVEDSDRAALREWLDESRVFRKTLPDLVREYLQSIEANGDAQAAKPRLLREEIEEQLNALATPTRIYQSQLPLFPDIYRIVIECRPSNGIPVEPIVYASPVPPPRGTNTNTLGQMTYPLLGNQDDRASLMCDFRFHAFNLWELSEQNRRVASLIVVAIIVFAGGLAVLWVYLFLRRERERELGEATAKATIEHQKTELLKRELVQREAERAKEAAEKQTLVLKSEMHASIGIMAGSYAHNIKNLLVKPNDLLARCIEADGLSTEQTTMLREVRDTLGTVTERLQQILRTVRRDPNRAEKTPLDLVAIVRDSGREWETMGRERWKLNLRTTVPDEPLWIDGDLSHLQQAIENLLFNARDATFEQRKYLRDEVHRNPNLDKQAKQKALLHSASWRGDIHMNVFRKGSEIWLEVTDNGIGMTEDVRQRCLETHFTTKRGNAVFEGLHVGMGLGLSFVMMILDNHGAKLEIESKPHEGTLFRVRFPAKA